MIAPRFEIDHIPCRTCQRTTVHSVTDHFGQRSWRCLTCSTVERRNPRPRSVQDADMTKLGIKQDRREGSR
jgi:hypothetical protein